MKIESVEFQEQGRRPGGNGFESPPFTQTGFFGRDKCYEGPVRLALWCRAMIGCVRASGQGWQLPATLTVDRRMFDTPPLKETGPSCKPTMRRSSPCGNCHYFQSCPAKRPDDSPRLPKSDAPRSRTFQDEVRYFGWGGGAGLLFGAGFGCGAGLFVGGFGDGFG
jgi:hypothetical protein